MNGDERLHTEWMRSVRMLVCKSKTERERRGIKLSYMIPYNYRRSALYTLYSVVYTSEVEFRDCGENQVGQGREYEHND